MEIEQALKETYCLCKWGHNPENIGCDKAVAVRALAIANKAIAFDKKENSWDAKIAKTKAVLNSPSVGDCFEEMCSFWCYVVRVSDEWIYTVETPGGECELPKDGLLKKYSRAENELYKRFTMDTDSPWVIWHKNYGENYVDGWFDTLAGNSIPAGYTKK